MEGCGDRKATIRAELNSSMRSSGQSPPGAILSAAHSGVALPILFLEFQCCLLVPSHGLELPHANYPPLSPVSQTVWMTPSSKCLTVSLLHFQALLYYCEALTKTNLQLQKAACLALKSLEVKPSPIALQSHTSRIKTLSRLRGPHSSPESETPSLVAPLKQLVC